MAADPHRFLRGAGRFTDDLAREDALHLAVVRSDLPHAVIEDIDASEAKNLPQVHRILTAADLDPMPRIPVRVGSTPTLESRLQTVLAVDRVRYVGEPIAIVLADTGAAARDAADAIRVDLAPLQSVADTFDPRSTVLWAGDSDNTQIEVSASYGPVEEIFTDANLVFDFDFRTSRRTGLPIETRQLVAEWMEGELHLWGATKFIQFTSRTLAEMFAIAPDRVVTHRVDIGGMFGVRGEVYPEDFLVSWAALVSGRMVRWQEGRREHLLSINQAGEQHHKLRVAVDHSGHLLGFEDYVVLDMGAYPRPIGSRIPHIIVETLPGPYRWEAVDLRCRGVATSKTPIGTIRGPAAFETTFARERMIDAVARDLGITPFDLRMQNLISSRSIPYRVPFEPPSEPITYDSGDFSSMLSQFATLVHSDQVHRECEERRANGQTVGLGWGLSVVHSGLGKEESVALTLNEEGSFVLSTSATEVGQGLDRTVAQILSENLGVPAEVITVASSDNTAPASGNGTFSSRSTIFVGSSTIDAALTMKGLAMERAGQILGCSPSDIRLTQTGAKANGKTITWKELGPLTAIGEFRMDHPTYGLAVHLAQVRVDPEIGEVRPERIWIGYDCGHAVDRHNVADQLVGAAAAGVSGALFERLVFEEAIPVSATLADYLIARAADVPEIHTYLFDFGSPNNPLTAKGVGEAGLIGAGAAVANAVADALGEAGDTISELPIRSETVFGAIRAMIIGSIK